MSLVVFLARCIVVMFFSWFCVRLIGKRSISQLTAYDFTALMILSNVAAEPLVFKITSKAFLGSLIISVFTILIGYLSLRKRFYNIDTKPDIVISNGKINRQVMIRNRMNLPFLLSLLRLQGYSRVSDVEFAIIEPNGNLSVIPTSQSRPVTPKDLNIETKHEGLTLPIIIDGEIQYTNLRFANKDVKWLNQELQNSGVASPEEVFLAELDSTGKLNIDLFSSPAGGTPGVF